MTFFDFNYISDPPNDETVDYATHLNGNWVELDSKLQGFTTQPNEIASPTVGMEAFYHDGIDGSTDNYRMSVWNGSFWQRCINHSSGWTAWQNITLRAPVTERVGYTPKLRANLVHKRIELVGGVLYNGGAAWPSTDVEITDDTAIQIELAPVHGMAIQQVATGQFTGADQFASAVLTAQEATTPDRTAIVIRWQGDTGGSAGTNFVMLDGTWWWYA